jgi:superfamily II DNA or RNA helicase/transposase
MKLRPYQQRWLERVHAATGRVLVVGPTGSGKTVVAAALMRDAVAEGKRVLFVAHRRELVEQCALRLNEADVKSVGVIMAGHEPQPEAMVQVASVQTYTRRPCDEQFGAVFIDEAHHATTPSVRAILGANPNAKVYGLTATPRRLDGQPLSDLFDSVAQCDTVPELITQGALAKVAVWTHPPDDLRGVKSDRGDYDKRVLAGTIKRKHIGDMVAHWEKFGQRRPTVVFAINVAHAELITTAFRKANYRAELLTSKTPIEKRAAILAGLADGDVQLVVNVEVLTEGWDCRAASCCIMARPTLSETLCLQMMGRVMRPNPKWECSIVLDHVGNTLLHGMPFTGRDWSDALLPTERAVRKHGDVATQTKTCPECDSAVSFGAQQCGFCEHVFWERTPPAEVDGWLQQVNRDPREWAIQQVLNGRKTADVADELGVHRTVVSKWCQVARGRIRKSTSNEQLRQVKLRALKLMQNGQNTSAVARLLNLSNATTWRWAKAAGLVLMERRKPTAHPKSPDSVPKQRFCRPDHEVRAAVEQVKAGTTTSVVARSIGVRRETLRGWCKHFSVSCAQRTYAIEQREMGLGLLRQGLSLIAASKQLGVGETTLRRWCLAAGFAFDGNKWSERP